ncbi:hypothetical protein [Photobacterium minamisatsumaniensis]|uniref:hypothetical protein n=1 Tax=Photobacterium minamisatsumaniensis TaxID=2910233 RepID=UPI003D0EC4F8
MKYAEKYTKREKIIRISVFGGIAFVCVLLAEFWFFPLLGDIARNPYCFQVAGHYVVDYIWHFLMVGIPFSIFLLLAITILPIGVRGLKSGQFPPKGMKVFKLTQIKTGTVARAKSFALILLPVLVFASSVWGYMKVQSMPEVERKQPVVIECES